MITLYKYLLPYSLSSRKGYFFLLVFVLVQVVCQGQQTLNGSILHDGLEREYIIYLPASYSGGEPVPLVLNFHGFGSNAQEQMYYGDFRSIADTAGFLIVHPQGTLFNGIPHWNVGGWTGGSTVDDVGFTEALIDSLANEYTIDTTRVYSTGMSNGGFMSFLLACQLSEKITAIASVTGSMTTETYNNSNPQHPTPILQIHGTADDVVPYNGTEGMKPIEEVLAYWVDYNNCNITPDVIGLPNIDPDDGSTVEQWLYTGGYNGVAVKHYKVIEGGHTWPGTAFWFPGTNNDINASVEIWNFLSQYDMDDLVGPTAIERIVNKELDKMVYPNPTNSYLSINGEFIRDLEYKLFSTTGTLLMTGKLDSKSQVINISHLPSNIYILKIGDKTFKVLKK